MRAVAIWFAAADAASAASSAARCARICAANDSDDVSVVGVESAMNSSNCDVLSSIIISGSGSITTSVLDSTSEISVSGVVADVLDAVVLTIADMVGMRAVVVGRCPRDTTAPSDVVHSANNAQKAKSKEQCLQVCLEKILSFFFICFVALSQSLRMRFHRICIIVLPLIFQIHIPHRNRCSYCWRKRSQHTRRVQNYLHIQI